MNSELMVPCQTVTFQAKNNTNSQLLFIKALFGKASYRLVITDLITVWVRNSKRKDVLKEHSVVVHPPNEQKLTHLHI